MPYIYIYIIFPYATGTVRHIFSVRTLKMHCLYSVRALRLRKVGHSVTRGVGGIIIMTNRGGKNISRLRTVAYTPNVLVGIYQSVWAERCTADIKCIYIYIYIHICEHTAIILLFACTCLVQAHEKFPNWKCIFIFLTFFAIDFRWRNEMCKQCAK